MSTFSGRHSRRVIHHCYIVHDQAALGHLARVTRTVLTNRNPWLLYKSSATFGNYLGSYGVLLSCIAGPMIADYWIVRRGHYRINDLYTAKKEGWYWYTYGINWRAYAAYLM